jgi:hypothetical protein
MNHLLNCALLVGLPVVLLLCGYWLAARLTQSSPAERLAVALLTGVGLLLWNVSAINFFRPLSGGWAWLCLWPIAVTLLSPGARSAVASDFRALVFRRRGIAALVLAAAFLLLMLWPLLTRPSLIFYDGTSNHDSFFWVSAAEHLMRHNYLTFPQENSLRPLLNVTGAVLGMDPPWGRMGAEGFLALVASLLGTAPLNIYLAASAALYVPWVAAVFLTTRIFLTDRLTRAGLGALLLLQPVFVFFFGNGNLPNLFGALCAALVVIATERSLRSPDNRWVWLALLALSFHGLLCSYPEMAPFVIIPGGLLWWRVWFREGLRAWRPATLTAIGWIAGLALNPATTVRAWVGFLVSFDTARADEHWANLFHPLSPLQYSLGLSSLSVVASKSIPAVLAVLLTIALIIGVAVALRRATDRSGAVLILSGALALLAYTIATQFSYGWQKTVQFGGPLWVAVLPVAMIDALARSASCKRRNRWFLCVAFAGIVAFFGYATVVNCREGHKWSTRKDLTQDWFMLRDYADQHLPGAAVLVDAASFRMAFFHGMWAAYFLREHDIYYTSRGNENGGYLRGGTKRETDGQLPPAGAIMVSRQWADTLDANSPRHFTGDNFVLLKERNQVIAWTGFYPENGPPESVEIQSTFDVRPHSRSELVFVLDPHRPAVPTTLHVRNRVEGQPDFVKELSGPPPWRIVVPLTPGKLNRVELDSTPNPRPLKFPFVVRDMRIQAAHD